MIYARNSLRKLIPFYSPRWLQHVKYPGADYADYASSKQGNGVSYQRDALPSYTSQYTANPHTHLPHTLAVSSTSAAAASVEVPHGFSLSSGSTLSARDAFYRAQEAAFIAATSLQQAPEVTFYSPSKGLAGGKLFVYARTEVDFITAGRQYSFAIMFGARKCDARLIRIDRQDEHFQYAISAEIPPFSTTGWLDSQVPLYLTIHDDDPGQPLAAVEVGEFTYADLANISGKETIPEPATKKRKFSSCSADYMYSPPRKILTLAGRETSRQIAINSYNIGRGVSPFQSHHSTGHDSAPLSDVDSPLTPVFNGYPLVINPPQSSVIATSDGPSALSHRQALQSPTDIAANPLLVRTSTLGEGLETSHTISPYALFPAKAALMIDGELESMGDGWLADEWNAGRRLVEFRREQSGCSIATTFRAVLAGEWDPNSICVSCIWWEERNECFVTSVDTIYLLESLVSARFSVEEKNRIRRNLEGFRPLTISKSKADSESFFKLIMGFPNPKPRNIEKDVKVFPWRILAHALKKIIGKYVSNQFSLSSFLLPILPFPPI